MTRPEPVSRAPSALLLAAWMLAVFVATMPAAAQAPPPTRCGTGGHESEALGVAFLPQDQIFCAAFADPKEPRTFVSVLRGEFRTLDDPEGQRKTTIGSVGIGDSFGLWRWGGPSPGEGVQIDVIGAVFAQFDLGAASKDLINADYVIGIPLTLRRGGFSARLKLYHQSSHLGDEYLLRGGEIQRENLSFEAVEALVSQEAGPLRVYGGFERLFRREPDALARYLWHGGVEARGAGERPRLVAAVDVKASEQYDWSPGVSARAGLEMTRSTSGGHPGRLVAILVEFYQGPSPYGQFYQDDISYLGIGLHFGL